MKRTRNDNFIDGIVILVWLCLLGFTLYLMSVHEAQTETPAPATQQCVTQTKNSGLWIACSQVGPTNYPEEWLNRGKVI